MDIICFDCHKIVCKGLPEDTVFKGVAQCPECMGKQLALEEEVETSRCAMNKIKEQMDSMEFYVDIETGERVHIIGIGVDTTIGNEQELYVAYATNEEPLSLLLKDYDEFHRQFEQTESGS